MVLSYIKYSQLKKAIRVAFKDDEDIYKYYDQNVEVGSVEDIVDDIYKKILDYGEKVSLNGVYENGELVGYMIRNDEMLISFGISVKYRSREYLKEFFKIMKDDFGGGFVCHLWNVNQRGINWLKKNDMKIVSGDNQITKLKCL